jgi:hypothetical protein
MSTEQNPNKTRVALAALAASAAVGAGALAFPAGIESTIASLSGVSLAQLKSTDDSVLANALRTARENTGMDPASAFNN